LVEFKFIEEARLLKEKNGKNKIITISLAKTQNKGIIYYNYIKEINMDC
jgi:hypothetical protein